MKKLTLILLFQILLMPALFAQEMNEKEVLKNLLDEFLQGASENNAAIHNRFWAKDLIYTSSNGERVTKQIIIDGLSDNSEAENLSTPQYHAEETQIQLFDDIAVVAFKLVAVTPGSDGEDRLEFYNTAPFKNGMANGKPLPGRRHELRRSNGLLRYLSPLQRGISFLKLKSSPKHQLCRQNRS